MDTEKQVYPTYVISTSFDEVAGKITSTVEFHNPEGAFGEKVNLVAHQVMSTKEKDLACALRKLGWVSPDEFRAVAHKYQEELDAEKKAVAALQATVATLEEKLQAAHRETYLTHVLRNQRQLQVALVDCLESANAVASACVCVGGPLNDNVLQFNKAQHSWIHSRVFMEVEGLKNLYKGLLNEDAYDEIVKELKESRGG